MSRLSLTGSEVVGSPMMGSFSKELSHVVEDDKHFITYSSGTKYEGQVNGNKWHGVGKVTLANGDTYEGGWKSGLRHGIGTYIYAQDGTVYTGSWQDGAKTGQGCLIYKNGDRFTGDWLNGRQHGHGVYEFSNGDRYEGEFRDGMQHGLGTYTSVSGDQYTGQWERGKKHGRARLLFAAGGVWEGIFEGDARVTGVNVTVDGDMWLEQWNGEALKERRHITEIPKELRYDSQGTGQSLSSTGTPTEADTLIRDITVSPAPHATRHSSYSVHSDIVTVGYDQENTDLQAKVEQLAQTLAREKRRSSQHQAKLGELAAENIRLKSKLQQIQIQDEQQVRARVLEQEQVIAAIMEELAELKRTSREKEKRYQKDLSNRLTSEGFRRTSVASSPGTPPISPSTAAKRFTSPLQRTGSLPTRGSRSGTPGRRTPQGDNTGPMSQGDPIHAPLPSMRGPSPSRGPSPLRMHDASPDRERPVTQTSLLKQIQALQTQVRVEQEQRAAAEKSRAALDAKCAQLQKQLTRNTLKLSQLSDENNQLQRELDAAQKKQPTMREVSGFRIGMEKERERIQLFAEKRQLLVALEKARVHAARERETFLLCIDALRHRLLRHGESADNVIADLQRGYEVEKLLSMRVEDGKIEYLVRWRGPYEDSWETKNRISSDLIEKFNRDLEDDQSDGVRPAEETPNSTPASIGAKEVKTFTQERSAVSGVAAVAEVSAEPRNASRPMTPSYQTPPRHPNTPKTPTQTISSRPQTPTQASTPSSLPRSSRSPSPSGGTRVQSPISVDFNSSSAVPRPPVPTLDPRRGSIVPPLAASTLPSPVKSPTPPPRKPPALNVTSQSPPTEAHAMSSSQEQASTEPSPSANKLQPTDTKTSEASPTGESEASSVCSLDV